MEIGLQVGSFNLLYFVSKMSDQSCFNLQELNENDYSLGQSLRSFRYYEVPQHDQFPLSKGFWQQEDQNVSKQNFGTTRPGFDDESFGNQQCIQPRSQEQAKRSLFEKDIYFSRKVFSNLRKPQIIQTSISVKERRFQKVKGEGKETKNIIKSLFTLTSNYLKMLIHINQLTEEGQHFAKAFLQKKDQVNFGCFKQLLSRRQLRQKCHQYFCSKEFMINLMGSRSDVKSKLIFIKYMEIMRSLCVRSQVGKWKDFRYKKD